MAPSLIVFVIELAHPFVNMRDSGVTESLLGVGGQDDGIAMKGAQSKAKWGGHGVNGGIGPRPPPPRSYATAERERWGGG